MTDKKKQKQIEVAQGTKKIIILVGGSPPHPWDFDTS